MDSPSQSLTEPEWIFPFEGMDVGDSFLIPTLKPMGILYIIDTRAKAAGYKIRTSIVIEGDILGVRVWRVD